MSGVGTDPGSGSPDSYLTPTECEVERESYDGPHQLVEKNRREGREGEVVGVRPTESGPLVSGGRGRPVEVGREEQSLGEEEEPESKKDVPSTRVAGHPRTLEGVGGRRAGGAGGGFQS